MRSDQVWSRAPRLSTACRRGLSRSAPGGGVRRLSALSALIRLMQRGRADEGLQRARPAALVTSARERDVLAVGQPLGGRAVMARGGIAEGHRHVDGPLAQPLGGAAALLLALLDRALAGDHVAGSRLHAQGHGVGVAGGDRQRAGLQVAFRPGSAMRRGARCRPRSAGWWRCVGGHAAGVARLDDAHQRKVDQAGRSRVDVARPALQHRRGGVFHLEGVRQPGRAGPGARFAGQRAVVNRGRPHRLDDRRRGRARGDRGRFVSFDEVADLRGGDVREPVGPVTPGSPRGRSPRGRPAPPGCPRSEARRCRPCRS